MRHSRTLASTVLAGSCALAFGGCGSIPDGGPALGATAPNFQATTASGESFDLRDKRGSVVVLDFYANT